MAWIEPKTDWVSSDYFNVEDYNRITGNLTHLQILADDLFKNINTERVGVDKDYTSMIYAREMNEIEDALEDLNLKTYRKDIGEKQVYRDNGLTPLWSEFNRIETACQLLYDELELHQQNMFRIAFNLGNQKGIRV